MRDPAFDPNNPDDTGKSPRRHRRQDARARRRPTRPVPRYGEAGDGRFECTGRRRSGTNLSMRHPQLLRRAPAQAFVNVRKETIASLEENLRVANERFKAGTAVQTDVLNLEVQLAQAREDLKNSCAEQVAPTSRSPRSTRRSARTLFLKVPSPKRKGMTSLPRRSHRMRIRWRTGRNSKPSHG